MDVKQEYHEIYEHNIKTEEDLIYGQTEENNSLSIKPEKFKNDEDELDNKVGIFESQVTGQLISADEFKQDIIECELPKIERSEVDRDLGAAQVQIFPTSTIKQELENTAKVEASDICEYVQFKNESELLTSHCDLQTLKSENNDYPDNLKQSCSSTEDISNNCSKQHPCIACEKNYPPSPSEISQIDGRHFKKHCSKQFSDPLHLSNHVTIRSNEKKQFNCHICSKEFDRKLYLKQHLLLHSNKKPFKCDICSKDFKLKQSLQRHLIIHTTETPFKCDICSKEFRRKLSLQQHLLAGHNEISFKCDICFREFKRKRELKSHLIIHSMLMKNPLRSQLFQ